MFPAPPATTSRRLGSLLAGGLAAAVALPLLAAPATGAAPRIDPSKVRHPNGRALNVPRGTLVPQVGVFYRDGRVATVRATTLDGAKALAARLPSQDPSVLWASVSAKRTALSVGADPVLDDLEQFQTHLTETAIHSAWRAGNLGAGVKVAIIDSGIDPRSPELADAVVARHDFTREPATAPLNDHGTAMASLVAAARNGDGIVGLAPMTQLLDARVLDRYGEGASATVAQGVNWAVAQGANIILMAMGGSGDTVEKAAIDAATAAGVLVIAAAGNEFFLDNAPSYPAAYPNVLAVAATGPGMDHAFFSNTGSYVDLAAPGFLILASTTEDYDPPNLDLFLGTSPASAIAVGMAASALSADPSQTADQLRQSLLEGARDLGAPGRDNVFGAGMVQPPGGAALTSVHLTGPTSGTSSQLSVFSATVTGSGGPQAGVAVDLVARLKGRTSWSRVATGVTNSSGVATLPARVVMTADYAAYTRRDEQFRSLAAPEVIRLGATSSSYLRTRLISVPGATQDTAILYGRVYPSVSMTVQLQRWYAGLHAWRNAGTVRTNAEGRFSVSFPGGNSATSMRMILPTTSLWGGSTSNIAQVFRAWSSVGQVSPGRALAK